MSCQQVHPGGGYGYGGLIGMYSKIGGANSYDGISIRNGKVGIRNSNPEHSLDVSGTNTMWHSAYLRYFNVLNIQNGGKFATKN